MHSASEKLPFAAPAERSACTGRSRDEARPRVVEARLAARLRVQVHDRAPSARDREEIAGERLDRARDGRARRVEHHHVDGRDAPRAAHVDDDRMVDHLDAGSAHALGQLAARRGPRIDDRGDFDAGGDEAQRRPVRAVVVGEHDGLRAGLHAVAIDVGGHRGGQHHAGTIVVREDERALHRARREHHLLRAHAPDALARPRSLAPAADDR